MEDIDGLLDLKIIEKEEKISELEQNITNANQLNYNLNEIIKQKNTDIIELEKHYNQNMALANKEIHELAAINSKKTLMIEE